MVPRHVAEKDNNVRASYWWFAEVVDCFTARWHTDEAERSWLCHAAWYAKYDTIGKSVGDARSHADIVVAEAA